MFTTYIISRLFGPITLSVCSYTRTRDSRLTLFFSVISDADVRTSRDVELNQGEFDDTDGLSGMGGMGGLGLEDGGMEQVD